MKYQVLVTSGSKKIGMIKAVKAAMVKAGIQGDLHCGDTDQNAICKYFADKFWKMPPTSDENAGEILRYSQENGIRLIVPSRDGELAFWASQKAALEAQGTTVMVSDRQAIDLCLDKLKFSHLAARESLPIIETDDLLESIQADRFVVKERFGAGSTSIGIDLDRSQALEHAKTLANPVFQPFIPGKEYSADFYVTRSGQVKGVIARERNVVVNGESQVTTTIRCPEIQSICTQFAASVQLYGHIILQLIQDSGGNFHIIECNPRFGGASTAAIAAGLDSFYWLLQETSGQDLDDYPFNRIEGEIKQIRYPEDLIIPA